MDCSFGFSGNEPSWASRPPGSGRAGSRFPGALAQTPVAQCMGFGNDRPQQCAVVWTVAPGACDRVGAPVGFAAHTGRPSGVDRGRLGVAGRHVSPVRHGDRCADPLGHGGLAHSPPACPSLVDTRRGPGCLQCNEPADAGFLLDTLRGTPVCPQRIPTVRGGRRRWRRRQPVDLAGPDRCRLRERAGPDVDRGPATPGARCYWLPSCGVLPSTLSISGSSPRNNRPA